MRMIDGDRLLRELTALSHGQVWPGWTYEGIRLLIERQPTLTPPNEPLTLEQLRQMDGKPVYVVIDDGLEPLKMWALVDYIEEEMCLILTNNLGGRSEYYDEDNLNQDHITAYRHPPEGET